MHFHKFFSNNDGNHVNHDNHDNPDNHDNHHNHDNHDNPDNQPNHNNYDNYDNNNDHDNHDNQDNQDNQVRLAHLWVEFRVIFKLARQLHHKMPSGNFRGFVKGRYPVTMIVVRVQVIAVCPPQFMSWTACATFF